MYVLIGPDEREKGVLAGLFGDIVDPELRAFNVERVYGGETSPQDVVAAARTLPMMTDRRVVVVLQAERLLGPKRRGGDAEVPEQEAASPDLEPLIDYLQQAADVPTTLVFVLPPAEPAADGKRRHDLAPLVSNARITKALAKAATVVSVGDFESAGEVTTWLAARAREAGVTIERAAAQRLIDGANGDAVKFRADVERVLTYAAGEPTITATHVEEAVTANEESTDDWALVRALERGDAATALKELRSRLDRGDVPFQILGQIGYAVRTPPPRGRFPTARLARAVDALFRTDIALKSSGGDTTVLMERLVVELCA